jgi:AraC-like DNA-binding protein
MVSNRCKLAVKEVLKSHGLHFIIVDLGEVEIMEDLSDEERERLKKDLIDAGFELMDDKGAVLIQKIKKMIIDMIARPDELLKMNFSEHISKAFNRNYTFLANLFSEVQGTTIENFIMFNKIERIKELIIFGELNLTEISWKMNYSSVGHLSNQFKKVTGLTPSHFKKLKDIRQKTIKEINIKGDIHDNGATHTHQSYINENNNE